jgi:hypothetical protein
MVQQIPGLVKHSVRGRRGGDKETRRQGEGREGGKEEGERAAMGERPTIKSPENH